MMDNKKVTKMGAGGGGTEIFLGNKYSSSN